jgi:hypothetical protein
MVETFVLVWSKSDIFDFRSHAAQEDKEKTPRFLIMMVQNRLLWESELKQK